MRGYNGKCPHAFGANIRIDTRPLPYIIIVPVCFIAAEYPYTQIWKSMSDEIKKYMSGRQVFNEEK
jgi:hypothetical protein